MNKTKELKIKKESAMANAKKQFTHFTSIHLGDGDRYLMPAFKPVPPTLREIALLVKSGGGTIPASQHDWCRFTIAADRADRCTICIWQDDKLLLLCDFHEASPTAAQDWEKLASRVGTAWPKNNREMPKPKAPWAGMLGFPSASGLTSVGMLSMFVCVGWVAQAWHSLPMAQKAPIIKRAD